MLWESTIKVYGNKTEDALLDQGRACTVAPQAQQASSPTPSHQKWGCPPHQKLPPPGAASGAEAPRPQRIMVEETEAEGGEEDEDNV